MTEMRRTSGRLALAWSTLVLLMWTGQGQPSQATKISRIETITLRHPWGPVEDGKTRDWLLVLVHANNGLY